MLPRASLWVLCLLLLLGATAAQASPKLFVGLDYRLDDVLAGCPTESAFKSMVEGQVGYDPFRSPASWKVVASAHAGDVGLRGVIEWYDASGKPRGERRLSSEHSDCAAFARALSFAVAVQIQLLAQEAEGSARVVTATPARPESSPRKPAQEAGSTASKNADSAADDDPQSVPGPGSGEGGGWRFLVGGGPFVALGLAPRAAPGARVFVAGQADWLALELGAEATLPANYARAGGVGFDEHVAVGSVAGCLLVKAWSVCSISKLGRIYVEGYGVELPREPSGVLAYTGARLMLSQELSGRWLGALRLESLASLAPWEVTLNQRSVWTTPPVTFSLGVDLALLLL